MNSILNKRYLKPHFPLVATSFCSLIIAGLFTSSFFRILPSIGIIGLLVTALIYFLLYRETRNKEYKVYIPITVIFFLHLSAGLNTDEANRLEYWRDVLLQSPFLLLPVSFAILPEFPAKYLRWLWIFFCVLVLASAIVSTSNYLQHVEQINEQYLRSKIMPTEPDHIRFSLMVTLASAFGVLWIYNDKLPKAKKVSIIAGTIFLIFFQHLLAVRSGLITMYAVAALAWLWLLVKSNSYKRIILLTFVMIIIPLISYLIFPTFRNKFTNTREDVSKVNKIESANNYSLVGRVYSYKVAYLIIKEHPWFGIGKADMDSELAEYYKKNFPAIRHKSYIKPHNQFLYNLVAYGIVGLVVFLVFFFMPCVQLWSKLSPILVVHYTILTLSFLVEYTLETQIGLTFSILFIMLAIEGNRSEEETHTWKPA
ncbi:O-antigen ligase family protein [Hymenobacter jejuensis]|uniref:O-antigen ligase family protein n=1 Tax=Hymenobacter jejuensis TaxID=2502781 RepID=A0A5B8A229_9BACT|nr:O-antigen ligase family protein [Hymenobacter jejuensis]QDA60726.1 O-antigen ligase family protein [Hymenobacter jejuensis]